MDIWHYLLIAALFTSLAWNLRIRPASGGEVSKPIEMTPVRAPVPYDPSPRVAAANAEKRRVEIRFTDMEPCLVYELREDIDEWGGRVIGYTQHPAEAAEYASGGDKRGALVKNGLRAPNGVLILDEAIKSLPLLNSPEMAL